MLDDFDRMMSPAGERDDFYVNFESQTLPEVGLSRSNAIKRHIYFENHGDQCIDSFACRPFLNLSSGETENLIVGNSATQEEDLTTDRSCFTWSIYCRGTRSHDFAGRH